MLNDRVRGEWPSPSLVDSWFCRRTGLDWASKAGTSTKDLMARMGHDDMRAALIYQRATSDADKQIADRLSKLVDRHRKGTTPDDDEDQDGQPVPVG